MRIPKGLRNFEVRGDCHIFGGYVGKNGYGYTSLKGKRMTTHRAAFLFYRGEIPPHLMVLHTCGIRTCINPKHLYLGTASDNLTDRWRAYRAVKLNKLLENF